MNQELKIAVVGAGAIGGICAAFISRAGFDVQVVTRREEQARAIREKGIRVTGVRGQFHTLMDATHEVSALKPDRNLVLLGIKATALDSVARQLSRVLAPDAMVVSLQNGLCEQALADILGQERVIGCVTGWGATLHSDINLEMTSTGDFILGSLTGGADSRLEQVREVLGHVLETRISENITGDLYAKLIINSCISSVGALCGLYLGAMLARKDVRCLFFAIMAEAMAVARAMEIRVAVYAGKLDYEKFLASAGFFSDLKRHIFLRLMGFKYRRLKSSTLQSLERGQKTEIEFLTGFITENAKKYRVAVPVNDQILDMVREIEAGKRRICPENLNEIRLS